MKYSIVIPLYNKAPYISQTINSVLSQSVQDFEIIVVDDGSTDGGASIVRSISDPRIRLIQQENAGVSKARNRGIQAARAEYVAFLDADDEWCPGFLEKIGYLADKYPQCIMFATAYFAYTVEEENKRNLPCNDFEKDYVITDLFTTYLTTYPFTTSSVCVKKQSILDVGGFPEIIFAEDVVAWLKLSINGCIAYSQAVLAVYNRGTETSYLQNRSQQQELVIVSVLENWLEEGAIPKDLVPGARELFYKKCIDRAQSFLERGDFDSAKKYLQLGSRTNKKKLKRFVIAAALRMPRLYKTLITIKRRVEKK